MEKDLFTKVVEQAARECGCSVSEISFDDDDNVFEVILDKTGSPVCLGDCEHVHRAVLAAFDRDVEDYALTVGSSGLGALEADRILETMKD